MTDTPAKIDPRRSALLVMDYQNGIIDRMPESPVLVSRAGDALDLFRRNGGQVGYVRVGFEDSDLEAIPETSMMGRRVGTSARAFHADSPATAIHDDIAPRSGDIVVRKTRVGAFSTTDLDDQLRARHVDTLVLAGISTSGVLLSTVRDASDRDYRVVVLADVSADPESDVHTFLIEKVFPRQADVITLAELEALLGAPDAG